MEKLETLLNGIQNSLNLPEHQSRTSRQQLSHRINSQRVTAPADEATVPVLFTKPSALEMTSRNHILRTISSQKELRASRRRRPQTSKVAHKSFNQFSMAEETESKFHSNAGGEMKVLTSHSPSQLSSVQNVR
jgi:hypothetical protein